MGIWVIGGNHFSIGLTRCFISYLMHMALLDMVATPETENEERANKCTEVSKCKISKAVANLEIFLAEHSDIGAQF